MKNYELDETALYAWLPWGGLMNPCVQRNKDGSFIGIINLVRSEQDADSQHNQTQTAVSNFNSGWCLWHEYQHYPEFISEYIFILWNPLYVKKKEKIFSRLFHMFDMPKNRLIWNTLTDCKQRYMPEEKVADYFHEVMTSITNALNEKFSASLLRNEEIINALSSVISMQQEKYGMPQIPLFFDVICSDADFQMRDYDIVINQKMMSIISVPALHHFSTDFKEELLRRLSHLPYRLSMRVLLTNSKDASRRLDKYLHTWCKNRSVIRNTIREDVLKELNGYFSNTFIFFNDNADTLDEITEAAIRVFRSMSIPYIVERKNYKTAWWSSIPGIFRAKEHYTISGCTADNFFRLYS